MQNWSVDLVFPFGCCMSALVFISVDMWASPTRYVLALLELDILSLRANSIWDKSLVCAANISSASAHIEFVYLAFGEVCKPYRKSREGFISMRDTPLRVSRINRVLFCFKGCSRRRIPNPRCVGGFYDANRQSRAAEAKRTAARLLIKRLLRIGMYF